MLLAEQFLFPVKSLSTDTFDRVFFVSSFELHVFIGLSSVCNILEGFEILETSVAVSFRFI